VLPSPAQNVADDDADEITPEFTGATCTMEEGCITCSS
jgi:hypothetical protein